MKESKTQSYIMEYLALKKYFAWRSYVGPIVRGGGKQGVRFSKNPMKGFPDITFYLNSRPEQIAYCEVKAPGEKCRPEQDEWHRNLRERSSPVIVAESLGEFVAALDKIEGRL